MANSSDGSGTANSNIIDIVGPANRRSKYTVDEEQIMINHLLSSNTILQCLNVYTWDDLLNAVSLGVKTTGKSLLKYFLKDLQFRYADYTSDETALSQFHTILDRNSWECVALPDSENEIEEENSKKEDNDFRDIGPVDTTEKKNLYTANDDALMIKYLISTNSILRSLDLFTWNNLSKLCVLGPEKTGMSLLSHFVRDLQFSYKGYTSDEFALHQFKFIFDRDNWEYVPWSNFAK